MTNPIARTVIRGEVIDSDLIEYPGRAGGATFMAPDPRKFIDRLPLASPGLMTDLYDLSFDDILDYLEELGKQLDINSNEYMQEERDLTYDVAPVPNELVDLGIADSPRSSSATRSARSPRRASDSPTPRAGSSTR